VKEKLLDVETHLEDIVLNGTAEVLPLDALLLSSDNVHGQNRQHSAVHRHGDAHLVQRDAVEQHFHVLHAVNRHTSHTDVTNDTRVVAVVPTVSRQVEGNGETLLTGCQVLAIESIRLLGGGEAGILTDRPRTDSVHRRSYTTSVRENTRELVDFELHRESDRFRSEVIIAKIESALAHEVRVKHGCSLGYNRGLIHRPPSSLHAG
jgi:hypothetical protein